MSRIARRDGGRQGMVVPWRALLRCGVGYPRLSVRNCLWETARHLPSFETMRESVGVMLRYFVYALGRRVRCRMESESVVMEMRADGLTRFWMLCVRRQPLVR